MSWPHANNLNKPSHLFVYGLLRSSYHHIYPELQMDKLPLLGEGKTHGVLYDLGEYPAADFDELDHREIAGEVFELGTQGFSIEALDEFEDVHSDPPMYKRVIVKVVIEDTVLNCWAYQYLGDKHKPVIESGIF